MSSEHLCNLDVERAALAVVLDGRQPAAWGVLVQHCPHPGYFFARDHQLLALVIAALADRGARVDVETVCQEAATTVFADAVRQLATIRAAAEHEELPGKYWKLPPPPEGVAYEDSVLMALGGYAKVSDYGALTGHASGLEANCRLIADHYRQRRLVRLVERSRDALLSAKGVRAVGQIGSDLINGASQELGRATGDVTMAAAVDEAVALHDQVAQDAADGPIGARRASWGLASLDQMVPLTPDVFAVLAAPPGGGKTSLMMQAVEATAEHGPDSVCVVSREMGPAELARILVARRLGLSAADVRDGRLCSHERRQVQEEAERWRLANSVVIQADQDRVTVDDVCAWARLRATRAAGRLRLIVIDYLQLLDGVNPRETEYQRVSHATRRLKLLQRSLRVPVLLLSQMSRDGTKASRSASGELGAAPEPQLSDLRGSGTIEQDANAIIMLWPRQPPTTSAQGVTVKVAKNRSGSTGLIDCVFHRAAGQVFKEVQAEAIANRAGRMETPPSSDEDVFG